MSIIYKNKLYASDANVRDDYIDIVTNKRMQHTFTKRQSTKTPTHTQTCVNI